MNELDELEDVYFGKKNITDAKERAKLTGLYRYIWLLQVPSKPDTHVPYNLLTYLAKIAPKGSETEYLTQKLRDYGYVKDEVPEDLKKRFEYALNWAQDFAEIKERAMKLGEKEAVAVREFIQILQTDVDEEQIQGAVFSIARKHSISPKIFFKSLYTILLVFKSLYTILLGVSEGPRLGPYVVAMGRKNVTDALKRTLKKD